MALNLHTDPDPQVLREAFGHFPSGVAALAAEHAGERHVIVASSFSVGVSLAPPLVAVFIQKGSSTWPCLAQAQRIGVSILGNEHGAACRQLAERDKQRRFDGVAAETQEDGAIRIAGAAAWFACSVFDVYAAGDHDAFLLRIHDLQMEPEVAPLVFHRSRFTSVSAVPAVALMAC
ncbi:oxidoreductase [Bordetella sp. J329]|uniref:flavin reductase family protein n=1 Tax=Kerstersia gyiorum TaxID=206506 RepID=UPI000FDC3B07|nr:flavin reductase family protein [Kerstersia gyiorum]AZV93994.1 oxidoreductase [Bordetella sp. J329]MCH4272254.1 flavin reductase family protein [Kerstersia gyiorum]MCI1228800.1 flavin reductase family protein [Kerstersia gyiorum]